MRPEPDPSPDPRRPTAYRREARAAVLAGTLLCSAAAAQNESAPASPIERELAGIRSSLERIVALLDAQERRAEGDMLLRRIEIKTTRILPVEERLRRVHAEMADNEGERRRLRNIAKELEERSFEAETEEDREAVRDNLGQIVGASELLEQRSAALEEEQARLQTEQAQLAAEIEQLERELDLLQARSARAPR